MILKFTGSDFKNTYLLSLNFRECAMIKLQHFSEDVIKLLFPTFSLKSNANRWLYSTT